VSRSRTDLGTRIEALSRAVQLAPDDDAVQPARVLLARAAARRRLAPERTVVALAGGTGSGKSTLFNCLVGADLAPTGVRRPTTSRSRAAAWPAPGAGGSEDGTATLLDWLEIRDRHAVRGAADLAGLVLVDLPDYDSTVAEHRAEAERMTGVADLLVWVVDPQKYADAALHERYLRPLVTHRDVMLVVLNQADRLREADVPACMRHLARLLDEDGLGGVPVLATSARSATGLDALHSALSRRVSSTRAAVERLHADVDAAAARLLALCDGSPTGKRGRDDEARCVAALERAAGVPAASDAAAVAYRRAARARVGWPLTRWLSRLRPDPLRRLTAAATRLAVDPNAGIQRAQVSNAVRDLVDNRTRGLPPSWVSAVREDADRSSADLPASLGRAVAAAPSTAAGQPRWWGAGRAAQALLLTVAAAGAVWLAVLAVLGYLRLSAPSPHIGRAPVPTVLLVGGLVAGILLALALRPAIAFGARRRGAAVSRQLSAAVRAVAEKTLLAPLEERLRAHRDFCAALKTAAARR
jgi:predicted GTPase